MSCCTIADKYVNEMRCSAALNILQNKRLVVVEVLFDYYKCICKTVPWTAEFY